MYIYFSYGTDCMGKCSCVMNQTSSCSAINGACNCLPGFEGYTCETTCSQGFYGENCKNLCPCLHNSVCDAVSKFNI